MSERIHYCVTATMPDEALAGEYLAWLTTGGHVAEVLAGGAAAASVVRLDPAPTDPAGTIRIMTRYEFADRAAFERYERDAAPALRADGIARFGPQSGKGITFERAVGAIVA